MATTKQRQALAKQQRREQKLQAYKQDLVLKHYTKPQWVEAIKQDGVLELEGCNIEPGHFNWQALQFQYREVGRYVWFTEDTANSVCCMVPGMTSADLPCFTFKASDIDVEHWPKVKATLKGKGLAFANMLDELARENGDNPNKWWVSRKPVSMEFAI